MQKVKLHQESVLHANMLWLEKNTNALLCLGAGCCMAHLRALIFGQLDKLLPRSVKPNCPEMRRFTGHRVKTGGMWREGGIQIMIVSSLDAYESGTFRTGCDRITWSDTPQEVSDD